MDRISTMDMVLLFELATFWFIIFFVTNLIMIKHFPMPPRIAAKANPQLRKVIFVNFISNLPSFIHAVIAFVSGLYIFAYHGVRLAGPNLFVEGLLLSFSLGYFLNDTILSWIYGHNTTPMMLHHYQVVFVAIYVLAKDEYGSIAVWTLVIAEASNPFNILRVTFEKYKGCESAATITGIAFAVVFIYCRSPNKDVSTFCNHFAFAGKYSFAFYQDLRRRDVLSE